MAPGHQWHRFGGPWDVCVYHGIREFRLETFYHRLFLQAPSKQKGKEKEYKTEIQKSRDVKTSINWFHSVHAGSSGEGVFPKVRQESSRVVGILQTT